MKQILRGHGLQDDRTVSKRSSKETRGSVVGHQEDRNGTVEAILESLVRMANKEGRREGTVPVGHDRRSAIE
jgi:hypothetical protein